MNSFILRSGCRVIVMVVDRTYWELRHRQRGAVQCRQKSLYSDSESDRVQSWDSFSIDNEQLSLAEAGRQLAVQILWIIKIRGGRVWRMRAGISKVLGRGFALMIGGDVCTLYSLFAWMMCYNVGAVPWKIVELLKSTHRPRGQLRFIMKFWCLCVASPFHSRKRARRQRKKKTIEEWKKWSVR